MSPRVTRIVTALAAASLASAGLVLTSPPATADPGCLSCTDVAITPEGLLAQARSQMNELNSVANDPPPCNDETPGAGFPEDGNDTIEFEGYIRWVLTLNEQHVWDDDATTTGYRRECYLPTAPHEDDGSDPYNGLLEVRIFDAISPQTLAQVAIDDMLTQVPTHSIETNPSTTGMVAIPTWFWVTGVPETGVQASASVPGIRVVATATPGAVNYDFGDGTSLECSGGGTPYSPGTTSDCTHDYQRSGTYTITSTILWTGTYTVNGQGPYPITTAVPRTDSFTLAVNEAQAINTGSGG